MINALYKFTPLGANGEWLPYVGGGVGAADLKVDGVDPPNEDFDRHYDGDYNFAYQVFGGVGYAVNPSLSLVGELRFFGINSQDYENDVGSFELTYRTFNRWSARPTRSDEVPARVARATPAKDLKWRHNRCGARADLESDTVDASDELRACP